MAKLDDRPFDSGLANVRGKSDAEILEWMKQRLTLVAGVPTDVARAGALLPMLREMAHLTADERRRLTKLRLQAVQALSSDQQEKLFTARRLGNASDPQLLAEDTDVVRGLKDEVSGIDDYIQRSGT